MKHFRSEYAFKKHKPHVSLRKRILRFFRKKQYVVPTTKDSFHYKTNPFKIHKKPRKIKVKLILFVIFLLAWVVSLAYIPYFKINKVNYSGLNNLTKTELDEVVYGDFLNKKSILPVNNYFFIDPDKISKELYKKFALEGVEVKKVFPHELNINIKEKISSIIYDNGKKYFLLDAGGVAIKYLKDVEPYEITEKITSTSVNMLSLNATSTVLNTSTVEHTPDYKKINQTFGNYPIVYDRRGFDVEVKQENVLPSEHIVAIITWYKAFNEQEGIGSPKFFVLDNLNSGIDIDTSNAWNILFQPKNDITIQINNLKNIIPTIKPQEYVDLRFGEKVYWK